MCLMSPHYNFKSRCIKLRISHSKPNSKRGAEMRLGFKSSQFPYLSYKSCHTKMRCESNSAMRKRAADDHQVLCTHSDAILDAYLQAVWLPCYLKDLRVDLDICKPSCRAHQQQCSHQIPQSGDAWFSTGGKGMLQQNQMMDSRKTSRNPAPGGLVKERAVGLLWGAQHHMSNSLALGLLASLITATFFHSCLERELRKAV